VHRLVRTPPPSCRNARDAADATNVRTRLTAQTARIACGDRQCERRASVGYAGCASRLGSLAAPQMELPAHLAPAGCAPGGAQLRFDQRYRICAFCFHVTLRRRPRAEVGEQM